MARYTEPDPGEWVQPRRRGYKLACCDCGLVHRIDFRLARMGDRRYVQTRFFRDNRATAAIRRAMKLKRRNRRP